MIRLDEAEAALVATARWVVGQGPLPLERGLAPRLGTEGLRCLRETLSRGVVRQLARRGGWQTRSCLEGGRVVTGRLWDRHPSLPLRFSPITVEVLAWLGGSSAGIGTDGEPTLGDELVIYFAASAGAGQAFFEHPAVRASALCWLGFAPLFGAGEPAPVRLDDATCAVLEALQSDLARRWVSFDRDQAKVAFPAGLIRMGRARERTLGAFLGAASSAGRRDLCGCVLEAAREVLAAPPRLALDPAAPLSERSEARRAAGALVRTALAMRAWDVEHRTVRFFDEGYAAAQALASAWSGFGDRGFTRAEEYLRGLEPLGGP